MSLWKTRQLAGPLLIALLAGAGLHGQDSRLPTGSPESLGFSSERLTRLDAAMQRAVDEGTIAGMVILAARHGQVFHFKAFGKADREQNSPMRTDTIFRLASTTKIVTTVAVMQLMEEGRLLV